MVQFQKARTVNFQITEAEKLKMFDAILPLSGGSSVTLNWDLAAVGMSCVRGIFIDNSNSNSETTLTIPGTYMKFSVPPQAQAIFPVMMFGHSFTINAVSGGGVDIPIQLYNFQQTPFIWYTTPPGAIAGTVPITGTVTANPANGAFVNKSGTITLGGTAQNVLAINGARKQFLIQNPYTAAGQGIVAAESLFINFTGVANAAPPSVEILPGGSFLSDNSPVTTQALSVFAATTGHAFTCWEM